MKNKELDIDQLKAYIHGELQAEYALFVEQMLAESDQWRDVYEGLLIAEEQSFSTGKIVQRMQSQLPKKGKAKVISIEALKRWSTVAAALVGILVISYATIYFLSPQPSNQTAVVSQADREFSIENEIQIIEPDNESGIKLKSTVNKESKARKKFTEEDTSPQPTRIITPKNIKIEEGLSVEPQKMVDYLARNGYRQLRFKEAIPVATTISKSAQPAQGTTLFEQTNAENYIARFPFTGIVEISFLINEAGNISDLDVINTISPEATESVKKLIIDRTEWRPATDANGHAVKQRKRITASFGNTVYLELEDFK